jgi:dihydroorotate dehydrogenase
VVVFKKPEFSLSTVTGLSEARYTFVGHMYKSFLKRFFFLFPAERAHYLATDLLHLSFLIPGLKALARTYFQVRHPKLEREVFGLKFPNPVGLAAGFDKQARMYRDLEALGFGFIEVGTITPKGQPGNPKPRLFRLPLDEALINRLGFNNDGMEVAVNRLKDRKSSMIIGGNIGKNKTTPNEDAVDDYRKCFEALYPHVDYFVVNVSSPNTPNLRALQDKEPLTALLSELMTLNRQKEKPRPVLLKIAPDLSDGQLDDIVNIVAETGISGVIATNTTISRDGLKTQGDVREEQGGLSGAPLRDRSTEVIRYLHQKSSGSFPIIGVGGVQTGKDALQKLKAGASLVQVYTGFIYEGPAVVRNINRYLIKNL